MSIHISIIANREYRPTILLRKACSEDKNDYRDILANLSRCLEHHVEALQTLVKGGLPFKTIIIIPESAKSRKRAFRSSKINPRKYVASNVTN